MFFKECRFSWIQWWVQLQWACSSKKHFLSSILADSVPAEHVPHTCQASDQLLSWADDVSAAPKLNLIAVIWKWRQNNMSEEMILHSQNNQWAIIWISTVLLLTLIYPLLMFYGSVINMLLLPYWLNHQCLIFLSEYFT